MKNTNPFAIKKRKEFLWQALTKVFGSSLDSRSLPKRSLHSVGLHPVSLQSFRWRYVIFLAFVILGVSSSFLSPVYGDGEPGPASPSAAVTGGSGAVARGPSPLESFLPIGVMLAVFYFLLIRPQAKRQKDHQNFLSQMKRGERVLTNGGILGTIEALTDQFVTLEIADGVNIKVLRSQILSAYNPNAAAAANSKDSEKGKGK